MSSNKQVEITAEFPVRYAETDAMGVVHHANYLIYFEEGRSHYMRTMGSDYALIERSGFQLPVTEAGLRYVGSLTYGERVSIRTQVEENRSRRITFAYTVSSASSDRILVTGFTRHVWTNANGKVTSAPDQWTKLFTQHTTSIIKPG